ncbi:hypothetical protein OSG_eHP20_00210 [environmental Halophage eHP-20]|nr:hypothetical protein OSG_eHP20_00210 [environmental Halophage eHP-20]
MSLANRYQDLHDKQVAEYRQTLAESGEPFPMLKTLKIIRSIIVNIGFFGGWYLSLQTVSDPLVLSLVAFAVIGAYNGLEYGDYLALLQALQEVQQQEE